MAPAAPPAAKDTTTFYLKKSAIRPALVAINQLQQRDDLPGKMARKVGRIRRALSAADEEIQAQRQDLVVAHAEKYPEGHELAGKPTPAYMVNEKGEPVFKKDAQGNDTEERIVVPDQYNILDPMAFNKDWREMLEEVMVVACPCFLAPADSKEGIPELERFKGIKGAIVDPLLDLEEGADTTIAPEERKPLALVPEGEAATAADGPVLEPDIGGEQETAGQ
jgi:hypothetical protein